jgi:hypothetical protein
MIENFVVRRATSRLHRDPMLFYLLNHSTYSFVLRLIMYTERSLFMHTAKCLDDFHFQTDL